MDFAQARKTVLLLVTIVTIAFSPIAYPAEAQIITISAADAVAKAEIIFSPASASFQEGSIFEVPIYINTKGVSINAVELHIRFNAQRLAIVRPSGGKSIIGLWVEPPSYDNFNGTIDIIGAIPGGIVTNSGLIATLTFQAKTIGEASVTMSDTSHVLINDGAGSPAVLQSNRGSYTILPKPPEGVRVFSETHPFQDRWYNNDSPVFTWNSDPGVTGFSYTFDDKPNTVPDNTNMGTETIKSFEKVGDGVRYFHIKPLKQGVWGTTSHYTVRIDTTPPASFTPTVDYLSAAIIERFLISFFTTDSLSGINHYEVAVIDKSKPLTESAVFIQTESPYQLPYSATQNARVIVRAFDNAGNARDASIDVSAPFLPTKFVGDNAVMILLGVLALILIWLIYYFGRKIIKPTERALYLIKQEEQEKQRLLRELQEQQDKQHIDTPQ